MQHFKFVNWRFGESCFLMSQTGYKNNSYWSMQLKNDRTGLTNAILKPEQLL